jgi:hypothetical protein
MTNRLLINGDDVSPRTLSPAPPSPAFFVNVFEFDTGNWLGTVPAPSPDAIPLSLLQLSKSSSQFFRLVLFLSPQFRASFCVLLRSGAVTVTRRFQISAVLSSLSPFSSSLSFSANASASPEVFLDGIPVQASADNQWNLTVSQFSRSLIHIELSGSLAALNMSFTTDSSLNMLPVCIHFDYLLFSVAFVHTDKVILNGILMSSSSVNPRSSNVSCPHRLAQTFLMQCARLF